MTEPSVDTSIQAADNSFRQGILFVSTFFYTLVKNSLDHVINSKTDEPSAIQHFRNTGLREILYYCQINR